MLQYLLRPVRVFSDTWDICVMKPVRMFFSTRAFIFRTRILALVGICALLGAVTMAYGTPKAFAMQAQPPTDWSFYVNSTSTSSSYNWGCNMGKADASHSPVINSEVVLDFGGQLSNGSGTLMINGITISNAQIEAVAEEFAHGYWDCTGLNDTTSVLKLGIGTNNSYYDVSYGGGQTWVNVVAAAQAYDHSKGYDSQVVMMGANDMEPGFGSASSTISWSQGFASVSGYLYLNYGSADGCPQYSTGNGSCNNGWNQYDEWYVSWGSPPAIVAPEIYYSSMARQWAMISLYGAQSQGSAVQMQGPLDEYDLDTSTLTPAQAWSNLWTDLNNNSATAQNMPFSLEIHQE
ncbi:hypothetical protein [Dictyobacter formicarum]|uniref:Uncharacterized protein n=1 Tax=Dictyobacter formicarum TaxID=2778368 RepID=A0ABQ3VR68_9CHLR|nr:hypothetical protein [Dictyobacter formicarum]GHO87888.1 hypothetical protein KSZ_58940 [Dictyobacter formicarum]